MSDKGNAIRFTRGKYKGQTGWVNKDKKSTKERIYVIVDEGDKLNRTWVKKTSVKPALQPRPTSYSEAVLQQCPDVEARLEALCAELATCLIERDPNGIVDVFNKKLTEACNTHASKSRALYRSINYSQVQRAPAQPDPMLGADL
jgi:hypothetical protein